jgi:hypothetical protein
MAKAVKITYAKKVGSGLGSETEPGKIIREPDSTSPKSSGSTLLQESVEISIAGHIEFLLSLFYCLYR